MDPSSVVDLVTSDERLSFRHRGKLYSFRIAPRFLADEDLRRAQRIVADDVARLVRSPLRIPAWPKTGAPSHL